MRKALLVTLLLATLPLLVGFGINRAAPHPPSTAYHAAYCTRYCEAHGCPHAIRANSPAFFRLRPLYVATIRGLAAGGRRWYAAANIALYVVVMPLLLVWLTYGALRDAERIRQLRKSL